MGDILNAILYQPIAWILNLCFNLVQNYGVAIFMLTFIARAVLSPSAIKQQKGMAKQIRMRPKIAKLQKKYGNDKQKMQEEQQALFAKEGYNPMSAGCLPMVLNLIIMVGLYNVIYNPLTYILKLSPDLIASATEMLTGLGVNLTRGPQLIMMNHLDELPQLAGLGIEKLKASFYILGLDLTQSPDLKSFSAIWIIPILSGLSSFAMSFISMRKQKETNPEMAKGPMSGCMTFGMPLFSLYIAFSVPAGVGFYWVCSNIIGLIQTILINKFYSPNKVVAMLFIEETIERRSKEERKMKLTAAG